MRLGVILMILVLVLGCSRSPERTAPIDKVDVVATVYPLAQVVRAVGGAVVNVRWLVESGQSLRGLGEAERSSTQSARLILLNSSVTEPWVGSGGGMSLGGQRLLPLNLLPSARSANPGGFLWLDPVIVREAAVELHNRLLALRARQQAILNDRTDAFTADLDTLLRAYLSRFQPHSGLHILAFRHDFDPFLTRLKLVPDVPMDRDPTDLAESDLRYVRGLIQPLNAQLLLIGDDTPPATREQLKAIGLPIVVIDPLGSSATSGRDTYPALMRFNYESLWNGLQSNTSASPR